MTEREKRGKVIKGLECCTMPVEKCGKICPYQGKSINSGDNTGFCETVLMLDALDLLKAKEPQTARLLTADEVQHLQDRQTVCIEQLVSKETDERGYITGCAWGVMCNRDNSKGNGLLVSMLGTFFPNTVQKIPYKSIHTREDGKGHYTHYTVLFRFWTDRPTNEESRAVKWE